jgi:hypothetical protein
MRHSGYQHLGPIMAGQLPNGGLQRHFATLRHDACYVLAFFGETELRDVAVSVVSSDGVTVATEGGTGSSDVLSFCPEATAEYEIRLQAHAGAGPYQVAYWYRPDQSAPGGSGQDQRLALGRQVEGQLRAGERFVDYPLEIPQRRTVVIELQSREFDTFLYLLRNGAEVDRNDDGGDGLNSRLVRTLERGAYVVRVGSFADRGSGGFVVSVR